MATNFNLSLWLRKIDLISEEDVYEKVQCLESGLVFLPRSYKLWMKYITLLINVSKRSPKGSRTTDSISGVFERAISNLNKMPKIWIMYCNFVADRGKFTVVRSLVDRALQALPLTQHSKIWSFCLSWISPPCPSPLSQHFHQRHNFLQISTWNEDVVTLAKHDIFDFPSLHTTLNEKDLQSFDFTRFLSKPSLSCVEIERILRSFIFNYPNDLGRLWNTFGEYFTRLGFFERARDVLEEGILSSTSLRDFTVLFDSLVKIEEYVLAAEIRYSDLSLEMSDEDNVRRKELNLRLSRLEHLMEIRPLLINGVKLRKSPQSVHLWRKRFQLLKSQPALANEAFHLAVDTIDPQKCSGKFSAVWIDWAIFYEQLSDLAFARRKYVEASNVQFRNQEENLEVICAECEFEFRRGECHSALLLLRKAFTCFFEDKNMISFKNETKLFLGLCFDLEESFGSIESYSSAFSKAFDSKLVTLSMVINFSCYLEERGYFEDSFSVYERALSVFQFPQARLLWFVYLQKFAERFGKRKLFRLEQLFEQVLKVAPDEDRVLFYLKHFEILESFGQERKSLAILRRACLDVSEPFQFNLRRLYLLKSRSVLGMDQVRSIFTDTVAQSDGITAYQLCLIFFEMERDLGEIERARAVLKYTSQFTTSSTGDFWTIWRKFEETYGSEDTYKDMIRLRRSRELRLEEATSTY